MIDQIVDACRQPIGLDLHRRELRAKGRQTLTEALAEMLELRTLEVRRSSRYRCTAQSQGHCRGSQIKQREHHVQHGRKSGAVISKLKIGWNLAIVQHDRRRGVRPKSQAVPGTRN